MLVATGEEKAKGRGKGAVGKVSGEGGGGKPSE